MCGVKNSSPTSLLVSFEFVKRRRLEWIPKAAENQQENASREMSLRDLQPVPTAPELSGTDNLPINYKNASIIIIQLLL